LTWYVADVQPSGAWVQKGGCAAGIMAVDHSSAIPCNKKETSLTTFLIIPINSEY